MAWTTPGTATAGEVLTAAFWNENVRDNSIMGSPVYLNEAARDAAITAPVEGMQCYLTAPTVPAATGELVNLPSGVKTIYNGSVWVCVTEIGAIQTASGSTTSTSYTGSLTGGGTNISVTLVTGSSVLIWSSVNASCSSAGNSFSMSVAISGAGSFAASDAYRIWADAPIGNYYMTVGSSFVIGGLTAGTNTFTANYKTSTNTAYFRDRRFVVKGIA
jgi:hypothetical protein